MGDEQAADAGSMDVPVRHREHRQPARPHAVLVRLSDEERRLIVIAAKAAHLTPTGFTAMAAIAAADNTAGPATGTAARLKDLQRELFAARRAVNMFASNVNQAAAALNATGELPDWVTEAVRLCRTAVGRLDEVTGRIDRQLR
jgi:uncharacterized protein (DUF1778 family)